MAYSVFKTLVCSVIAQPDDPDWNLTSLSEAVHESALERGLLAEHESGGIGIPKPDATLTGPDFARLVNVVRDLIDERLIRPGRWEVTTLDDLSALGLPFFHVTETGRVQFAIFKKGQ